MVAPTRPEANGGKLGKSSRQNLELVNRAQIRFALNGLAMGFEHLVALASAVHSIRVA